MASVEIVAAWIGGGCTIFAAAIAFGTLAAQGHQNRKADQRARKQAFNESLYADGIAAARAMSNASNDFMAKLYVAQQQIGFAILVHQTSGETRPPSVRYPEFLALQKQFNDSLIDLVFLLEERRIADERLDTFKRAFLARAHDAEQAFSPDLQSKLMRSLEHVLSDGTVIPYAVPAEQTYGEIEKLINPLANALHDCTAFSEDLIIGLQNALLGDVFGRKVRYRTPGDPAAIVLDLDNVDKVESWIAGSAWERRNREAEAKFAASLVQKSIIQTP